jgi:hypothetical protein
MTRTDPRLFDARIADWLEHDPHRAPETALPIVLAAFPSIKQRRGRAPWRVFDMPSISRFAATSASVVALMVLALVVIAPWSMFGPGGTVTPTTSPTATPRPTASQTPRPTASSAVDPSDTSAWVQYRSDRYGFTLRHPADWQRSPADHDWTIAENGDVPSTGHEHFQSPGDPSVGVSAWSFDPDVSLTSVEEIVAWVQGDFCIESGSQPCAGIPERAVRLCVLEVRDCHPAVLIPFRDDVYAFIPGIGVDSPDLTIVAVWRPESHPSVSQYGGARDLLLAFLSTYDSGRGAGVYLDPPP